MRKRRYGYSGKILRVNLADSSTLTEPTEKYVPKFLGGRGLNQWILLNELKSPIDAFEPENIVCFGAGALVGTMVPGAARLKKHCRMFQVQQAETRRNTHFLNIVFR